MKKLFLLLFMLTGLYGYSQITPLDKSVSIPAVVSGKTYRKTGDTLTSKLNTTFKGTLVQARQNADGYNTVVISDYGGGTFYYDASDSTSIDNTGTVFVTQRGARFKRVYDGDINVLWFGAKGNGLANNAAAFQLALNNAQNGIYIPKCDSFYNINDTVIVPFGISMSGPGKVERTMPLSKNTWLFKLKGNNRIENLNYDGGSNILSELGNLPLSMKDFIVDSFGNVIFKDNIFKNSCGSFISVINPYSFSNVSILNNVFNGQRDHAIYLQGGNVNQGKGLAIIEGIDITNNTFLDDGTIRNHVIKLKNIKNVIVTRNSFRIASRAIVIDGSLDNSLLTSLPDSNITVSYNTGYCYEFVTCIVGELMGSGSKNIHVGINIVANNIRCVYYAVGSAYPPTSTIKYYGNLENISITNNFFTCRLGVLFNGNPLYGGIKKALISDNDFHIVSPGNSVLSFFNYFNTIDFVNNTVYFDTLAADKAILNTTSIVDNQSPFISNQNGRINIKNNKLYNANSLVIERPVKNTYLTSLNFNGYFSGNQIINKNQQTRFFNLTSSSLSVNTNRFTTDNSNVIVSDKVMPNILQMADSNSTSFAKNFVVMRRIQRNNSSALQTTPLILSVTSSIDFGSIPANSELVAPVTITLTGATTGDEVTVQATSNNAVIDYKAFVTSANTITVYAVNFTTAAINPPSQSFKFVIIR